MTPYIIVVTPFTVAGRTNRHKIPNVRSTADVPAFDFNPASGVHSLLDNTNALFAKSDAIKHCEIYMVYDADLKNGEFSYFFGRGIFHPEDMKNIPPDIVCVELSGLYAIFSSPLVPIEEKEKMEQAIKDLWNDIMVKWLPGSEFEYDETRKDFEHYDLRSHGQYFSGKKQMDIYIPIRQREESYREAMKNGLVF